MLSLYQLAHASQLKLSRRTWRTRKSFPSFVSYNIPREKKIEIRPGLNANEIQIPHDKHHKVSSLVKSHQNTHNSVKYEVI